jgi:hypothetical protein
MVTFGPVKVRQRSPALCAIAAMSTLAIAACSSSGSGAGLPPSAAQSSPLVRMSIDSASKAELFVSDTGLNEVSTFAWPQPKNPTGTLTGFSEPQGGCSDAKGDVYVANTGGLTVLGFEVGNANPIATLSDPGQYPVGCSYDWKYGNLAVTNFITSDDGPGSVSIYADEKGSPKTIGSSLLTRFYAVSYDASGNLYASGENSSYQDAIIELPAGSRAFKAVCTNLAKKGLAVAGWDGKYILFGGDGRIYRVKGCKILGSTPVHASGEVAVSEGRIAAVDSGTAELSIYTYPKGTLLETLSGFSEPVGVAVGGMKVK